MGLLFSVCLAVHTEDPADGHPASAGHAVDHPKPHQSTGLIPDLRPVLRAERGSVGGDVDTKGDVRFPTARGPTGVDRDRTGADRGPAGYRCLVRPRRLCATLTWYVRSKRHRVVVIGQGPGQGEITAPSAEVYGARVSKARAGDQKAVDAIRGQFADSGQSSLRFRRVRGRRQCRLCQGRLGQELDVLRRPAYQWILAKLHEHGPARGSSGEGSEPAAVWSTSSGGRRCRGQDSFRFVHATWGGPRCKRMLHMRGDGIPSVPRT